MSSGSISGTLSPSSAQSKRSGKPVIVIVRDGWGKIPDGGNQNGDATKLARTPVAENLSVKAEKTLVKTSGFDVGLPEDTMGNSEVGHQNIGAGRVVDQESVKITKEIRSGVFYENPVLKDAVSKAKASGGAVHLLGIVSDAGVHGLLEHLYACVELCKRAGVTRLFVHAFTDGRDTSPNSGLGYIRDVEASLKKMGLGKIASVCGRFYAMDRDNRWERVERAYRALRDGHLAEGVPVFASAEDAVSHYYAHPTAPNMTGDEFVTPCVVAGGGGEDGKSAAGPIRDGDTVIFYNYRGDRPREITRAFVMDDFSKASGQFDRGAGMGGNVSAKPAVTFVTMTAYEEGLPVLVAYPKPPKMVNTLGEYVSKLGLRQFRCAETEKFPHVTFFFNDYREEPFPGEDRHLCPSPKDVKTYDQKPEMAAECITQNTIAAIEKGVYDLIVVNYANCDMVGHTGVLAAAVKAVEFVDMCTGRLLEAAQKAGYAAIVTADHGNCELMIDPDTGGPHTAHTTFDVPLYVVDGRLGSPSGIGKLRKDGRLADIAPTALALMGLPKPAEMTGESLIIGGF